MTDFAESDFWAAIQIDPTDDKPVYNIALISMDKEQYAEAIMRLDRYVAMQPNDSCGYFTRGLAKMLQFREKVDKRPKDITIMADIIGVYEDMRKAVSLGNTQAKEILDSLVTAFDGIPEMP